MKMIYGLIIGVLLFFVVFVSSSLILVGEMFECVIGSLISLITGLYALLRFDSILKSLGLMLEGLKERDSE